MIKSPPAAAAEQSRERVVLVDILAKQMLDLEALRKEVAAAESVAAMKKKHEPLKTPRSRATPGNASWSNERRRPCRPATSARPSVFHRRGR